MALTSRHPWPDFVAQRLHGPEGSRSLCHICPLNGKRKVGADGDPDSEYIGVGEGPGKREAEYGLGRGFPYGRAFQGKIGYLLKTVQLTHPEVALVETAARPGSKWPQVINMKVFLMNIIMCRPPKNKVDKGPGRLAVLCCVNSALAQLRELLAKNPNRLVASMGATALGAVTGNLKATIEAHRGRPHFNALASGVLNLDPIPEAEIYAKVLRGVKPPKESAWWAVQSTLTLILRAQRVGLRRASRRLPTEVSNVLVFVKLLLSKQRAALKGTKRTRPPSYTPTQSA